MLEASRVTFAIQGFVILLLSLSVHEYAHAWTAYRLGDDTAARLGRLTLNPVAHIDWIGTVIVPLFGALYGGMMFGWANPVPVSPLRFRRDVNMWTGLAWTAAAGPLSNFVMALVGALALRGVLSLDGPVREAAFAFFLGSSNGHSGFTGFIYLNLLLGVFNLIPVPPLDGSRLLPRSMDRFQAAMGRYGFLFVLVLLQTPLGLPFTFTVGVLEHLLMNVAGLS